MQDEINLDLIKIINERNYNGDCAYDYVRIAMSITPEFIDITASLHYKLVNNNGKVLNENELDSICFSDSVYNDKYDSEGNCIRRSNFVLTKYTDYLDNFINDNIQENNWLTVFCNCPQ